MKWDWVCKFGSSFLGCVCPLRGSDNLSEKMEKMQRSVRVCGELSQNCYLAWEKLRLGWAILIHLFWVVFALWGGAISRWNRKDTNGVEWERKFSTDFDLKLISKILLSFPNRTKAESHSIAMHRDSRTPNVLICTSLVLFSRNRPKRLRLNWFVRIFGRKIFEVLICFVDCVPSQQEN